MPGPVRKSVALARVPARRRVGVAWAAGLLSASAVAVVAPAELAPLVGWDVAALVWLIPLVLVLARLDAAGTAAAAARDDPSRAAADAIVLGAAVASLAAVGLVLFQAADRTGADKVLFVGLAVASVVCSWAVVHVLFTLRYARLYYGAPVGGVDFNQDDAPSYADFAYLAFTIGMTFQVSDTQLTASAVRRTALRHALLSYLLGTVIVATTINLVAGLGK